MPDTQNYENNSIALSQQNTESSRGCTPLNQASCKISNGSEQLDKPVYTSLIDWNKPILDSDFLYRRQLSELRQHKENVKRLAIFDFDNTLFKSPLPNPRLWDQKLIGMLKSTDLGWFQDARTLSPPYLKYTNKHWIKSTVQQAQMEAKRDDTLVVLLTGRSHAAYRKSILKLLSLCRGLRFDIVILKETPTRQSPLVSPTASPYPSDSQVEKKVAKTPLTFDYKMTVVEDTVAAFPDIRQVLMWDDRIQHCERMQQYLDALVARSQERITMANVFHVPPQTIYMSEKDEKQLVGDFISEYNQRVRAASGSDNADDLLVGSLRMSTYPSFTAVFLTADSKRQLQRAVRSPYEWTTTADYMTIALGPLTDEELTARVGAVMGEKVELAVDNIGTIGGAILAVQVSQIRTEGGHAISPCTCDIPHITVAYNGPQRINPEYASRIRNWQPLRNGRLILNGVVGEHHLTTASIVMPEVVKDEVSIGGLVCRRWPELKGKDIGMAIANVRRTMIDKDIGNLEVNRERISHIVDSLF
ncbi:hypothetical protein IWW36_004060 [Coemansia brasiliensis]|uniref:Swiss Army Knife RNA repair protein HAD domain-containing protein n=1 Tax=Coemansia brasiliensis TaxID=2650707 RepID=A0A9W8I6M6_9FUNG|nr:hypothetical protein IWW36_004060 [Coemansia brasiliensis]